MNNQKEIKLTQTVQKGGCAAKVAAHELRAILSRVHFPPKDKQLMVDGSLFDDAAIYKVTDEIALVQTLDFFTPIVDSPAVFGAVATANALSDVYAMGGEPKTAMAILAFPLLTLPSECIVEIMQGASDKMKEAQVNFVGGHSIDDETLKFGLSVTGYVHPQNIWSNNAAKNGDVLILTKALGTGTCMAALKRQVYTEADLQEPIKSMTQLNHMRDLLNHDELAAIHAATDITGFGLLGHAQHMALASKMKMQIDFKKLPFFELTMHCLQSGFLTKAHRTNAEYTKDNCDLSELNDLQKLALHDPQTSGGLLLSVSPDHAQSVLHKLRQRFISAQIIGQMQASQLPQVQVIP